MRGINCESIHELRGILQESSAECNKTVQYSNSQGNGGPSQLGRSMGDPPRDVQVLEQFVCRARARPSTDSDLASRFVSAIGDSVCQITATTRGACSQVDPASASMLAGQSPANRIERSCVAGGAREPQRAPTLQRRRVAFCLWCCP